jgi:ABC-2 type transport system permease protein
MKISRSWIVAVKDIKVLLRKRYVLYSITVFPLIIGIGLPFVLRSVVSRLGSPQGADAQVLTNLMDAFSFFLVLASSLLPTVMASYSLVGEKIEKSLEPLLAAPITDAELLLGKGIAAFVPSVGAIYLSAIVYMILADLLTHGSLGYYYFPNWTIGIILLITMPLAAVLAIEWSVIVSARANDPRAAQLQGVLIAIPLIAVYLTSEIGIIKLNTSTIWIISGAILVADIILYFLSTRTFQREEILTKWT